LRPTQHKIGHFGDVPQVNPLASYEKSKRITQQKHSLTNQQKCSTTQNKQKKLIPRLVASYDIRPGNGESLVLFRRFIIFYLLT